MFIYFCFFYRSSEFNINTHKMNRRSSLWPVLVLALIFTLLFYRQSLGLNLLIFETLVVLWLMKIFHFRWNGQLPVILGSGLLLSGIFTILTHSVFVYILNLLSFFLFTGILIYPPARSLVTTAGLAFVNLFLAPVNLIKKGFTGSIEAENHNRSFRRISIFLIPLLIIMLFIFLYRAANPVFDGMVGKITDSIGEALELLFKDVDVRIVLTFILGLIVASQIFIRSHNQKIVEKDLTEEDRMTRKKRDFYRLFRPGALKSEYTAALFLIGILNVILLIVNGIDIYWVWFNFEWQGQYLKQFVHEGTWLLILSILISVGIVLYFFRANLNFYSRNRLLKSLSYAWLAQNAVLAVSVAVRNSWYIYYYALAYKRIGVFLFLIMTMVLLFTVYTKVKSRKTGFYLIRMNALCLYILLLFASIFNWDSIIARYNFSHADRSFLHLDFLVRLSNKTLPILDIPLEKLQQLDSLQARKFPLESERNGRSFLLTPEEYHERIEDRKAVFRKEQESRGFLSWNYADYRALQRLK